MRTKRRDLTGLLGALIVAVLIAGCSEDTDPAGPQVVDFTGEWTGSIQHPADDGGTLRMTLKEDPDSIYGAYTVRLARLVNGRAFVQNYGGSVVGGLPTGSTSTNFSLIVCGTPWDFTGSSSGPGALGGPWRARVPGGVSGTFDVSR